MVGKNNQYLKSTKEGTRVESYSIKKFKVGAASVVIGASIFFGVGTVAQASEQVSDNTTTQNTTNTDTKATTEEAPKAVEKAAKVEETAKESTETTAVAKEETKKAETTKETTTRETTTKETTKENTTKEEKAANKTALKSAIEKLEQKLNADKNADEAVVKAVREELVKAKAVFAKADATQEEVDAQAAALEALNSTVVESNAKVTAEKEETKKEEEKAKSEAKQTEEVKEAKKELTQVTSEAEVTNVLANEAIRKNEVKLEAKPAVIQAVAKNEEVIKVANNLLGNDNVTKEQIARSLEELSNSIKAVYAELENAGVRRDGRYGVALSANEGYTYVSTELRKENGEFATGTGKSYKILDNNDAYRIYISGYQSENTDVAASNNGQAGVSGRTDIPLSKTEAQKLGREAKLWDRKIRVTGNVNASGNSTYGSKGAYEYLATEIYGYTYEQGNHYVYITDVKKRFELNDAAKAAGYKITSVSVHNMPPGLAYNENSDTIEGYLATSIQNGVYDMRYTIGISKADGTTATTLGNGGVTLQGATFQDLTAGWIGWQDSSAPLIQGSSKLVTIGDTVSHDIKYIDNDGMSRDNRANFTYTKTGERVKAGSKTAKGQSSAVSFTAIDGTKLTTEYTVPTKNHPQTVTAHTALNGVYTGSETSITDVIPGLNYDPQTGLITGTASEAGIFTVAAYAKDYNNSTNSKSADWTMYGQEAHENITIAVAPKITVKNVEAYATNVPVTISNGANKVEITMPDGTVTKLVVKDGNWTVAAGTTNTAVQEGAVLAAASTTGDSTVNLTVTPESTKYVGVDNIAAKATTDKVKANIQREFAMVNDAAGNTYKAMFNRATGKYSLPNEKAYELKDNGNGTSTLIERRVYTDAQANGDVKFVVYEFERTWNTTSSASTLVDKIAEIRKNGEVTAVGAVTRTETLVKKDNTSSEQGMVVTVSYDSVTNRWTSSDGTEVTAKETNAGWDIETKSGFKGFVAFREATSTDVASIQNAKPTATSTSYSEAKGTSVDLIKSTKASVAFADTIDDKSTAENSDTIKTKVTATASDGTVTTFDGAQAEETAYIQAQRTAAEKTQAAATAIKEQQDTQNELARLQELVDRQTQVAADAQKALDDLKLRTISPTAQELAERKLANVKEFLTSVQKQLDEAAANIVTVNANVNTARQAALEAEKAVETARAALKTAAEANLAKANAYVLSQKGRYKVTVRAVDSNGVVTTPTVDGTDAGAVTDDAVAETTYYIVVTDPEKSSGAQGQKQTDSMADNFNDGKEGTTVSDFKLVDPTTGNKVESVTTDQGTYTVDPTTGEVTFTPVEGFVGTATPMKVSANVTFNDEEGNPVTVATENTYTPTVYGVQPSTDETTGKQGQTQTSKSGKDRFSELNTTTNTPDGTNVDWSTAAYSLEGANAEGKVVVDGEGTYSIDPTTGVVTFEPLPTFKGEGKGVNVQVSVTATDSEGNKVPVTSKGKYTPTVTAVTPTAEPKETSGKQGQPQTQDTESMFKQGDETAPIDKTTVKLVDPSGNEVTTMPATKDGKEVGTYTIDPTTGVITFTPNKDFVGTPDVAKVTAKDTNGTKVETTYTPTVTPVVPTAEPKETTGKQGQPQTQDTEIMFKQGDETAPIDKTTVKLVDPSGNEVTSMPATKDGKEVGTYTIDPTTGVITFTPNKNFVGTPDVAKVTAKDTNGTKVETTYTPTVTPVTPTADPAETTDIQGKTQNGTPKFTPGNPEVPMDDEVPATFEDGSTTKTIPGEGTYTVSPDGTVTFVPEKTFIGVGTGVAVKRVDKNGTPVTAKYTPTVTPVKPEGTPAVSEGPKGQPQSGTPTFTPGNPNVPIDEDVPPTFEDGTTTKVVPGEGTYTIDKNGKVTFTPESEFTGKAKGVTVKRVDKNGTPVTATYTPTVRPVTSFKDKEGKEIPNYPTEDGTTPKKDIPGYRFVETKKLPNGDTEHVYEKVKTSFKDKEGNEIPNYPTEDGENPKKDIPGYRFVETKKLPNGDTEHVYEKVKTSFKDKEGKEIPNYPTEDGEQPKKDIPGYRFVETKKLPNGDTEHVYEKVKTPVVEKSTTWVDENGNSLKPQENGTKDPGSIPGYELVKTELDKDGNVRHIFKKSSRIPTINRTTIWTDENGNPLKPTEKGTVEAGKIPGYEFVRTVIDENGNVRHIFRKVTNSVEKAGAKAQPKRLANTGESETNTGLAGMGLAMFGGLLAATKRRKNNKN